MGHNRAIFLVEDNPDHAELVRRSLDLIVNGHPLEYFPDGETLFARLEEIKDHPSFWPGVILLDLKLPRMDGLTIVQLIKNHEVFRKFPVIVFTSSLHHLDRQRAYAFGANGYLHKPVDFTELKSTIEAVIKYWLNCNQLCYE